MSTDIRTGYKILTHDWKAPIRGGAPLCDGSLPARLPSVRLDISNARCAAGYNYAASIADAATIAGLWPGGRPARIVAVTAGPDAIERAEKRRSSTLTIDRLCTTEEIKQAMGDLVRPWASAVSGLTDELAHEQLAWFLALGQPQKINRDAVTHGLDKALRSRGLSGWKLLQCWYGPDDQDTRAWRGHEVWEDWNARGAWQALQACGAWQALQACGARSVKNASYAWNVLDISNALVTYAAVRTGMLAGVAADRHTVGIRDAYTNGLTFAYPVPGNFLGWVLNESTYF